MSRTVRSLLSAEEYAELKAQRSTKSSGVEGSVPDIETAEVSYPESVQTSLEDSRTEASSAKGDGGEKTGDRS